MRILTTHIKDYCRLWTEKVTILPGWKNALRSDQPEAQSLLNSVYWGYKLFVTSRHYDVVITGWEHMAVVFAFLQIILRRRKKPHVILYTLWNLPKSVIMRPLRKFEYQLVSYASSRIVVYSYRQLELYVKTFCISTDKFVCIPYYTTCWDTSYEVSEGDYIFSGGDYTRNYRTLIEAAAELPCRLIIAARLRHYFRGLSIPSNVEVRTVTHQEFFQLMAAARIVVVPLQGGLLQSGGQQTYLNAMAMGKPVVIADDCGADEYIINGTTGLIVPPDNSQSLREALSMLLENPELAASLGQHARRAAGMRTPECFFRSVLDIASQYNDRRAGSMSAAGIADRPS